MNFNRVIMIGRLTRDPEVRTFANGGKVAKFGFAVSTKKKNMQTGQMEDEPMFIDVDVFNRGEFGTLANVVEQYCRKGTPICLEGKLKLETWDDKATGQKRSKHMIVADGIQLLETKAQADARHVGGGRPASAPSSSGGYSESYDSSEPPPQSSGGAAGEEIPF
jgi:single-strand DNA-binding protein